MVVLEALAVDDGVVLLENVVAENALVGERPLLRALVQLLGDDVPGWWRLRMLDGVLEGEEYAKFKAVLGALVVVPVLLLS